ncbi:MAG TPA: glycoside hydrolase family 3 N-terminal domain-containing protein [Gemmatimonadaceae bacterium]|nr:glycoside hydrolase family 3 N-terminal domain-containing protein [Gemmatimonadaceae bacterium]
MKLPARGRVVIVLLLSASIAAVQDRPAYRNASLTPDARARDLLGRMTIQEKFWQLYMSPGDLDDSTHDYTNGSFGLQVRLPDAERRSPNADAARAQVRAHVHKINSIQRYFVERTRLGIPIIPFEEALHGLMAPGATVFPQAIGLAATWDTSIASRVAQAAARETRSRGIRQALSPVVNIATDVRWGRVEETYGEDPFMSSVFGNVFVRAFERAGVVATPKHFVANVGDGGRDSYPIDLSVRQLDELHFPPFESAIRRSGARSIMTSYNSVDGLPATQNRWLLTDMLKRDWGFTGFVISDAAATGGATVLHYTEPNTPTAARHAWNSGLDVVFQSTWPQHRNYWEAVRTGMVSQAVIDSAVLRVLRVKFQLGLFEQPFVNVDSALSINGNPAHLQLAREAAAASVVLLKNENKALPLRRASGSIAVIGTDAIEARFGGYSGPGLQPVSILDGLRSAAGSAATIRHASGPGRFSFTPAVVPDEFLVQPGGAGPGLKGEYFDNNRMAGAPRLTRVDRQVDFRWTLSSPGRGIPVDWYSARWTGSLRVPAEGVKRIGVEGNDGYRLWIDGRLILDNWRKQSYRTQLADVNLPPGNHDFRLEYFESTGNARLRLVWDHGVPDESRARIAEAVSLARTNDVVIVVAGIEEGEFRDRAKLSLPGHQEELISAVAATGKPVVVVLVGGSAITMPWLDRVNAVVMAWYPGEQGGHGVADVVFGAVNPSGRLPVTFPIEEGQLPLVYNHKPTGRGDDYLDLTGHPLFPFGFGLSYTTFEYDSLRITPDTIGSTETAQVSFTVTNTGDRAGHEVVQLYIRDVLASVARPVQELRGFQRLRLDAGERRRISIPLSAASLAFRDESGRRVVEPGAIRVMVGSSSRDIRLRGFLELRPQSR